MVISEAYLSSSARVNEMKRIKISGREMTVIADTRDALINI